LNKKVIEALAKSGALDGLGERNQILQNMDQILRYITDISKKAAANQMDLFSGTGVARSIRCYL